jgi:hypothetical protein
MAIKPINNKPQHGIHFIGPLFDKALFTLKQAP